jgi:hypothetical protein
MLNQLLKFIENERNIWANAVGLWHFYDIG